MSRCGELRISDIGYEREVATLIAREKNAAGTLEAVPPPQPEAQPKVRRRRYGTQDHYWMDGIFGRFCTWSREELDEMRKEVSRLSGQPLTRVRQVIGKRNSVMDVVPGRHDWKICRAFIEFFDHPETHRAVRARASRLVRISREEERLMEIGRDFVDLMRRASEVRS